MRKARNRIEIELIDRAEEWSCDGAGVKNGMERGKERISSCSESTRSGTSSHQLSHIGHSSFGEH